MLRKKGKDKNKSSHIAMSSISTISGGLLPKDICSLIKEFHQEASSFKKQINIDEIRQKMTQNSMKSLDKNAATAYGSSSGIKPLDTVNSNL